MGFKPKNQDEPVKRSSGNIKPLPLPFPDLQQCGRLRIGHLLTIFGVSAPEFYKRVKTGLIPACDGRDPRPFWEAATIRAFKASANANASASADAINCTGAQ